MTLYSRMAIFEEIHSVQVDTRNPHPSANDSGVTVGLGLLSSYEHMGMGAVFCTSGCECSEPALVFDAHWHFRMSTVSWVYFGVSQSTSCILEIRNVDNSTSGEHKLKVNGLSVLPFDARKKGQFAHIKVQP